MEKEYKYRIEVEVIGEPDANDLKMLESIGEGIECDGFLILGDRRENSTELVHEASIDDIARMITPCADLMQAAILAQAYFNSNMVKKEHAMRSMSELLIEAIKSKGD